MNGNEILWRDMVCSFCGLTRKHKLFISIRIATDSDENEYPYSQTEMCVGCWKRYGIAAALDHNAECRTLAGVK